MEMFEKLKQGILDEITVKVCDFLINDCDICPKFISSRCQENCNDNDKEAEEAEAKATMDARKNIKTGSKAPNDVPQGWIRLITKRGDIYMNASKIVSLGIPDPATASDGVATVVYTVGAEDDPWYVCDSIDTVMEKIKNAWIG